MDSLRRQFDDMQLIIIDEMSLVGADILYHIHKRFTEVCKNQDPFGNKAVLLCGDLLQIPPTKQRCIFEEPKILQNQALYNSNENLWESFKTVTLSVNKRQGISKWKDALSRIRMGGMNEDDKKLINSRRVSNDEHMDKDLDDALHLFYSNNEVLRHNEAIIAKLKGQTMNIKADIRGYPKNFEPKIKYESYIEETRFQKVLILKKGARVIHNLNVDIIDGLVNGVTGTVIGFSYYTPPESKKHLPGANISSVIVKFDDPNVGKNLREKLKDFHRLVKHENGVPIFRNNWSMTLPRLPSYAKPCVDQFPLNLFYASTSHKIQGKTLENQDVVCHTYFNIKPGCGYVMLSRCKEIDNVFISKDFDIGKVIPHYPSLQMTNDLERNCLARKLKREKFDIFYTNMRGKAHLIDVKYDPYANQSTLVCLVETNILNHTGLKWNEKICLSHESTRQGNGVCAFTNKMNYQPYQYELITTRCHNEFQILQLRKENKYQIFIMYISKNAILSVIVDQLKSMRLKKLDTIVLGDFNYDAKKNNVLAKYLSKTLRLKQIVLGPTYNYGPNTIDQIHVPSKLVNKITYLSRFNYYTDHMSFNICLP